MKLRAWAPALLLVGTVLPATVDGKPISVYYTITTTRTAVGSN